MYVQLTRFSDLNTVHQAKFFADSSLRKRIQACGGNREQLDRLWGEELRALDPEAGVLDERYFACYFNGRVYVWLGREHPLLVLLNASFVALQFAHPERRDPTFNSQHPLVQEGAALLPALRGVGVSDAREAREATLTFAQKVFDAFGEEMTETGSLLAHKAYLLRAYIRNRGADADMDTLYRCVVGICQCLADIR